MGITAEDQGARQSTAKTLEHLPEKFHGRAAAASTGPLLSRRPVSAPGTQAGAEQPRAVQPFG